MAELIHTLVYNSCSQTGEGDMRTGYVEEGRRGHIGWGRHEGEGGEEGGGST